MAIAATQTARAGGISLYEIATPDIGLASAGYASRAEDASTLFKNPAGMSRLDGAQLQTGLQALYGSVSFTSDAGTSPLLGPDNGGNAIGWLPGASLFVVAPISEKFHVGLGTLSYFGLASDYDDNWVGRYYVQESALVGVTLMPSASYQITEWLSVGAGLNAMYGYLDTQMAVNTGVVTPDGQMSLTDKTWGFGANIGVLIQASEKTRFGLTYLSSLNLDFADTPTFTGVAITPPQLNLGMTVPQMVMLSAYHSLNDQWALMADVGWQDWSEFGYVQAGVEGGATTTANLQYQDTWHGAIGAQYKPTDKWKLSGGVAFDSSAVSSENRTVTLPMGQAWRFGLGAQYQLSESVNIGAACTFMWCGNMSVNQQSLLPVALGGRGNVSGSFEDAWFTIANVNLTWTF
ncbi:MAG TPA: outer membrane protein transport protein [Verrucomicrobiae bacterium]|nr:outer membrane protein transport protein [Verrucomicrobiae bacterium]